MIARLVYLLMPVSVVLAFAWAPPAEGLGETSRILYFHVPLAWVSVLAFLVAGISAVLYLYGGGRFAHLEEKSHNSAGIGMAFTLLATVTGSIWAKMSWGSFWNWDPRETSIMILLLLYVAYFSLRSALGAHPSRGKIASAYLIFAMAAVPFFVFIVPRIYPSLHPDPIINAERRIHLDERMRITLLLSIASFTLLYYYILQLKNRISAMSRRIEERHYEE